MRHIVFTFALCLLAISAQAGTYKNDFTDGNFDGWEIENYGVQNVEWKVDKPWRSGTIFCTSRFGRDWPCPPASQCGTHGAPELP